MVIRRNLSLKAVILATSFMFINGSFAATSLNDETIKNLIAQVEALSERIKQLEAKKQSPEISPIISSAIDKKIALIEKVKIKGDFRLRYENIDDATKAEARDRSRVRARVELLGQVNDEWLVGLGLATGGDDPVSTNQTLGNGGSTKGMNLDMAYFNWSGLNNSHIIGGKFKNPFHKPAKTSLIWDSDYRPEGLAYKFDNGKVFANAAFMFLESDNKAGSQDTETIFGAQLGMNHAWDDKKLTTGISYYSFGVAGSKPFYDADFFSNTVVNNGIDDVYLNDYDELELFTEFSFKAGGMPASVFIDWVQNQSADDNETGYAFGASLGKAKDAGTWKTSYTYKSIEADSVFGLTTDSDFAGGGSNSSGHLIKAAYAVQKNVSLGLSYFINKKGDLETNYDRLQLDLKFKY